MTDRPLSARPPNRRRALNRVWEGVRRLRVSRAMPWIIGGVWLVALAAAALPLL